MERECIKILQIEDNPGDVRLIKEMLKESRRIEYIFEYVDNLKSGMRRISEGDIDVVILDLGLSEITGLETLKRLLSSDMAIPAVIVMTILDDEESGMDAVRSGAQDYLIKGEVDSGLLVRSILYSIERNEAKRKIQRANDELEGKVIERTKKLSETLKSLEEEIKIREEYERELKVKDNAIESSINPITMGDLQGNITYVNRAFLKLMNYDDKEKVIGRNGTSFWHAMNKAGEILETVKKGESWEGELVVKRENNTDFCCHLAANLVKDKSGIPRNIMASFIDISKQKKAEEALKKNLENIKSMMEASFRALSAVVNLRDTYTGRHQKRVTQLTLEIAKKMNLNSEQISILRYASMVHDVGKIRISSEILNKPGKLSDLQISFIHEHPVIGRDLFKKVEFASPIAEIIYQHHERMDGSGYPEGLKGDKIMLEAKIIAVADVVEAMSSHRPYRPSLGIEKALKEIEDNSGRLYDPQVVDACVDLFRSEKFKFEG